MRTSATGAGLVAATQSAVAPFRLHRPTRLTEAVDILATHPDACIAAGCTDLTAQLREGRVVGRLITVRRLPELQQVEHRDGVLRIGAGLTHHDGSRDPLLREVVPSLAAAWASIATVRIRRSATIGGNLLARRFRYELPVVLGALDAQLEFAGPDGPRVRPVAGLWSGDVADGGAAGAWETDGLLTAATVRTGDLAWFGYERSHRPTTTVALAVRRTLAGMRLTATVGSEYRRPYRATYDAPVGDVGGLDPATAAASLADQVPHSAGDRAGSTAYRRHLVRVLVARLLTTATEEARP
jgi:carbon-monoxide dehydrogenase medium subunit